MKESGTTRRSTGQAARHLPWKPQASFGGKVLRELEPWLSLGRLPGLPRGSRTVLEEGLKGGVKRGPSVPEKVPRKLSGLNGLGVWL